MYTYIDRGRRGVAYELEKCKKTEVRKKERKKERRRQINKGRDRNRNNLETVLSPSDLIDTWAWP